MSVIVIDPPAGLVVSLEEAKEHLRVDHDDDDYKIEAFIKAAIAAIDGPAGWLGRALISQGLELRLDEFSGGTRGDEIQLPFPPLISVEAINYDDQNGSEQTLDSAVYHVVGSTDNPRVALTYGQVWPIPRSQSEAVRLQYTAGYGENGTDVPEPIRQAILLVVSNLYENRGDAANAPDLFRGAPDALLMPYRVW